MIFKNPNYKEKNSDIIKNINGIVTSMHPSFIGNDRLSDGYNVWNKNGILSSRPGIRATDNGLISNQIDSNDIKLYYSNFPAPNIDSYNNFCALVKNLEYSGSKIDLFSIDADGVTHEISSLTLKNEENTEKYDVKNVIFIKSKKISGSGVFIILPVCIIESSTQNEKKEVQYYELSSDYKSFIKISPDSLYRPIIVKNGYGNLITSDLSKELKESRPEGVSLLNGLFEARFILDGVSYSFACTAPFAEDAPIEIRYYTSDASYKTVTVEGGKDRSDNFTYMGIEVYVTVNRSLGKIYFRSEGEPFAMPRVANMETLRIYSRSDVKGIDYEIFSSSVSPILFDSRLFIAGGENRGNKVYYSSKTEHLYFCEDYSVSVGNKSYNLTALSMQSKYIIAFKERELYRLSITCTDEISLERFEIDSKGMVFEKPKCTVTQINDTIGCDLPNTIVTCANRLVWFHSDGVVYTLYGSNLYTEGSIYELSADISDMLSHIPKENLKYAFAAAFNGYYVLGIKNKLYLMDVRVSGFRYLTNSKSEKENKLTWFFWEAPKDTYFTSGFLCGGTEYFIMSSDDGKVLYVASPKGEKDLITKVNKTEENVPEFMICTSIFGEHSCNVDKITMNAYFGASAEFTLFDENAEYDTLRVDGAKEYKSYIIPTSYKKGSIGIKIKGSGKFNLKNIAVGFKERIG